MHAPCTSACTSTATRHTYMPQLGGILSYNHHTAQTLQIQATAVLLLQLLRTLACRQGVLTLAYRGFPPALVSLKQQIGDFYQSLPKEVGQLYNSSWHCQLSCQAVAPLETSCCAYPPRQQLLRRSMLLANGLEVYAPLWLLRRVPYARSYSSCCCCCCCCCCCQSPGSRWPKTSLAALREGRRLTPAQLQRLNEICR
jgi:hypothetical protein